MKKITSMIISAPSGGGKGTVVDYLLKEFPHLFTRSVSYCTRDISNQETQGIHYVQVSRKKFEKLILAGELVEYEEIYGDYYGTPKSEFDRAKQEGKILLLDIDVNGAVRLKRILGDDVLFFFIHSGNDIFIYQERIIKRGRSTDTLEKIKKRIERIPIELNAGELDSDFMIPNIEDETFLLKGVRKILHFLEIIKKE